MCQKTRSFSIYLLREGFGAHNALADGHKLQAADGAMHIPENSTLYILDEPFKRPWWRDYFGVQEDLRQELKGALLFVPAGERCFALSFGHVFHHLKDEAYEYDFGLRVTLNSLDPEELKSADTLEPGPARRRRTQVPVFTGLTYLDFDGNSEIIKSLTGKVTPENRRLFSTATGAASLKVSMKISPDELTERCMVLFGLYKSDEYKTTFPNIQNIVPVKNPAEIEKLDGFLLSAVKEKKRSIMLAIPDIVDYRDNTGCIFKIPGKQSNIYPDISIEGLYKTLGDDFPLDKLNLEQLKSFRMMLTNAEGQPGRSYTLYRSLIFDTQITGEKSLYHFNEGDWYKAQPDFVENLRSYLDKKCEKTDLCAYNHDNGQGDRAVYSEGNYNAAVPNWRGRFICLDQTDISPVGSSSIEPCDLYSVLEDKGAKSRYRAFLYHIKISTRSSHLSHLFNQGVNSIELIKLEETSRNRLKDLVAGRIGTNDREEYHKPFKHFDFKVIFGIITRKDPAGRSANLPLFSKISLMRNMQRLDVMSVPCALTFIPDNSPPKGGHSRGQQILVEVQRRDDGRGKEVMPLPGQGVDATLPVQRCPRAIKDSEVGTRYRLRVSRGNDGSLRTYHAWPFEEV